MAINDEIMKETCKLLQGTTISSKYIDIVFRKSRECMLYYDNNTVVGVCMWKIHKQTMFDLRIYKKLHIYLLYVPDSESELKDSILHDIETYSISKGVSVISLHPLTYDDELYYERTGFKKNTYGDTQLMTKRI